ncbi:MAG: dihydropteroate synthase [Candidatus Omnitrophota bacterium]
MKRKSFIVPAGKFALELGSRTLIMGIINITTDSFSKDGLLKNINNCSLVSRSALDLAKKMKASGADIIDIGAESTRPGAKPISAREELKRLIPVIESIDNQLHIPISVDTYKSEVATKVIEAGASIINNIKACDAKINRKIATLCAKKNKALIIMHMRGVPLNMQQYTKYGSLISDIKNELKKAIAVAKQAGLSFKNIIIDPGIGFAKTLSQNLEIIKRLAEFASLGRPILIGVSRKSFIGKVLNLDEKNRLFGTAASVALAIANGAHIVRVHDVREMQQVAHLTDAILNPSNYPAC